MKKAVIFVSLSLFVHILFSGVVAYTSFEEPTAVGGQYTDTGDASVDHALADNADEPWVNWTGTNELGFSSYYYNTRNDVGLTDGDYVGVTNYTGTVGSFPDGSNGFQQSDCDGAMETTIETFSYCSSLDSLTVDYYVKETGWESDDEIRIWVVVDGGTEIDILNTSGSDIDDLGIEGSWITGKVDLSGYTEVTLKLYLDSNSSNEALYFDNIKIYSEQPCPVTLSEFTAEYTGGNLSIYWITQTETEIAGWNIYRGESEDALQNITIKINNELIEGHGTTTEVHEYQFVDEYAVQPGLTYWYWLESVDNSGNTEIYGSISLTIPDGNGENPIPPNTNETVFLNQNFPNPVFENTEIEFSVAKEGMVDLSVYNMKGQKIVTLYHGNIGENEINKVKNVYWNGLDGNGNRVSSGIYLYTLKTKDKSVSRKLIISQ